MNPTDPTAPLPEDGSPKPWHKPQPQQSNADPNTDVGGTAGNVVDGAAEIAGGALDAVGSVVEGVGEAAGGCLGGVADGCGGCAAAVLVMLAAAGTAMAFFVG